MRRLIIASPHRHADLARLWYRAVRRDLVPALRDAGLDVEVRLFRDADAGGFEPCHFPGAALEAPRAGCRDFIEFYDAALAYECDYLLLMDADVFFLDGVWPASYLSAFDDPDVAAVSFLQRPELPGAVYALLCRCVYYRELAPPVLAACYEGLEHWPHAVHRDPGEQAAIRLGRLGKRVVQADGEEADLHLADFHGTTNLRVSRELFGEAIGARQFEALIARKGYFARGAYDNLCLGTLYEALFGAAFAPGRAGEALAGSLTADALRRVLGSIQDQAMRAELRTWFQRSDRAITRLAAREDVRLSLPRILPESWAEV